MIDLSKYNRIVVTGPQRSGTTICAQMIAHDIGLAFHPEEDIAVNHTEMFHTILAGTGFVIQCPGMSRHIHEVIDDDVAVVWMVRNLKDILKSEKRIEWKDFVERGKYKANKNPEPVAKIKYDYWRKVQKKQIENAFEIKYESLKDHPLWVDDDIRKGWGPRQTI